MSRNAFTELEIPQDGGGDFERKLKLVADPGGKRYKVRFLGSPMPYDMHVDTKDRPFPDTGRGGYSRTCAGKGSCAFCELAYKSKRRMLINVANLSDKDDDGLPLIQYLDLPKQAMQDLRNWAVDNAEDFPGGPADMVGNCYDFMITITGNPTMGSGGVVRYSITTVGDSKPLPKVIVDALQAFNEARGEEDPMALIDLAPMCRPALLSEDLQIQKWGEVRFDVPDRNTPGPTTVKAPPPPAQDLDEAFGPAAQVEAEDEDPPKKDVKW